MTRKEKLEAIEALLRGQSTLTLSTADASGQPHATPLFYLMGSDCDLYWFSSPASVHSRNVAGTPEAACAIFAATANWKEICGVQMHGMVSKVADRTLRREISEAYRERFHLGSMFRLAMAKSALYCFRPYWIRYLDNTRRFGFKFEVTFESVTRSPLPLSCHPERRSCEKTPN
jgi:uncharacterized protein YhbP (UPF0306 family)